MHGQGCGCQRRGNPLPEWGRHGKLGGTHSEKAVLSSEKSKVPYAGIKVESLQGSDCV